MRQRRGYILLTVLLLLLLAAVTMSAVCRLAIEQSADASAATDELQRRWGTISCRDVILPRAESILELNETASSPIPKLQAQFSLGTEAFDICISDEQAKVNVNALYAIKGKDRAEQSIQALVQAVGGTVKARLRLSSTADLRKRTPAASLQQPPAGAGATDPQPPPRITPVFGSWSEVFPGVQLADLSADRPHSAVTFLTCWGNGSLNLERASLASLTQICSPELSPQQIGQLAIARSRLGDNATVDELFTAARLNATQADALSGLLTSASATQSLWIRSRDHSGTSCSLYIRDGSNSDDVRTFSFQW